MDSFTISVTGKSSTLESIFNPPIDLDGQYQIGLVDFQSYNSIHNVKAPNNVLYYYKQKTITIPRGKQTLSAITQATGGKLTLQLNKNGKLQTSTSLKLIHQRGLILKLTTLASDTVEVDDDLYYYDEKEVNKIVIPPGSYEINEIIKEIQAKDPTFNLIANNKTMTCVLMSSNVYDFRKPGLGSSILGFTGVSTPGVPYPATNITQINNVNVLRVNCNIAEGSFHNGKPTHSIHNFYPQSPPGYKIIEVPKNILYFPINVRTLDRVVLTIVDQNENIVDFNGEEISVRCHIKKVL